MNALQFHLELDPYQIILVRARAALLRAAVSLVRSRALLLGDRVNELEWLRQRVAELEACLGQTGLSVGRQGQLVKASP